MLVYQSLTSTHKILLNIGFTNGQPFLNAPTRPEANTCHFAYSPGSGSSTGEKVPNGAWLVVLTLKNMKVNGKDYQL